MAVLVEAVSVIIRRNRIVSQYPGGWKGFVADCPNGTLCADSDLARVGFMTPADVESFCHRLERCGLLFMRDGSAIDFSTVDQLRGPITHCEWLEYGHVDVDGHRVAACRLVGSEDAHVVTPDGWRYENSLSGGYGFVPTGATNKSLAFLRHENGVDVYLNRLTGKEVYVGRTGELPLNAHDHDERRGNR